MVRRMLVVDPGWLGIARVFDLVVVNPAWTAEEDHIAVRHIGRDSAGQNGPVAVQAGHHIAVDRTGQAEARSTARVMGYRTAVDRRTIDVGGG